MSGSDRAARDPALNVLVARYRAAVLQEELATRGWLETVYEQFSLGLSVDDVIDLLEAGDAWGAAFRDDDDA